ncbi:MAG: transketolase, partial [Hyphomonadaceae bacterium]|nr:transketolase [Hyphomonadaceae bacterium]
ALAQAAGPAGKPTLVACKTVIGFGAPKKAGTAAAHGEPLGGEELAAAKAALGWPHGPFEIPPEVAAAWRAIGARGAHLRAAWEQRLAASPEQPALLAAMRGETPPAAMEALRAHKAALLEKPPAIATRAASGLVLEALAPVLPSLFGGSADLSKSNVTQAKAMADFTPENPSGRYVRYGVREHGMAAAMNGMALHGGLIPYGGTFLCFADYARPSLRLAALMGVRTIHVMTHDSIGLGEDGPTHQPVEHLASLRAIPNLYVFRPADALETAECWEAALALRRSPSVLALSRQAAPALRLQAGAENLCARGAYELAPAEGGPSRAALFATGTEVELAMAARALLQAEGVPTRVVSCPCFELFEEQDDSYRDRILGPVQEVRFGVEAAIAQGWIEAFELDGFLGMSEFGASGPAPELYQHFGLTAEALAEGVRELLALTGEETEA